MEVRHICAFSYSVYLPSQSVGGYSISVGYKEDDRGALSIGMLVATCDGSIGEAKDKEQGEEEDLGGPDGNHAQVVKEGEGNGTTKLLKRGSLLLLDDNSPAIHSLVSFCQQRAWSLPIRVSC